MALPDVLAAGAVVTRKGGDVLLVHRPKYDDWAFPKGKLDPDEHVVVAAVREVAEETGLQVRLGPALPTQRYPIGDGRMKSVHYWVARVVGDDDVSGYATNAEIDAVEWVPWDKAHDRLSYRRDRALLDGALPLRRKTHAVLVVRHGQATPRKEWGDDDRLRPLSAAGRDQARALVAVLAAFGTTAVHTSPSTRCVDSVLPYVQATGCPLHTHDVLSEEGAAADGILDLVDDVLHSGEVAVVCSHRPVLPTIRDALALGGLDADGGSDDELAKGEVLVAHHRKGRVVATERHTV